jgi:hypothetical protein
LEELDTAYLFRVDLRKSRYWQAPVGKEKVEVLRRRNESPQVVRESFVRAACSNASELQVV